MTQIDEPIDCEHQNWTSVNDYETCYHCGITKQSYPLASKIDLTNPPQELSKEDLTSEPNLYEQIYKIIDELIDISCDYEQGEDVDLDAKANESYHAIKALIATQTEEAYKKGFLDGGMEVINGRSTQ